jgi:hypothetical protein
MPIMTPPQTDRLDRPQPAFHAGRGSFASCDQGVLEIGSIDGARDEGMPARRNWQSIDVVVEAPKPQ